MIRILIVEDEKPISNLIRLSLTKAGYHCTCVYDGNAAVDKLDREIFDLILLDIMLPGANGFEPMDYIRPLGIPVIFLTAVNSVNNRVRGLKMGAEDYIIKPFEIVELLARDFNRMTDTIEDNMHQMADAMKRQEEFMGSFTHELKTPMTSIIGYADLMRSQALDEEEQQEAAEYIFSEGRRLESLSLKLLDLLVLKKKDFELRPTNLQTMIEGAVHTALPSMADKNISLKGRYDNGFCLMESDLVKSLIINLIDNAKKAIDDSGNILVVGRLTEEGCLITVADTGRGMKPEELSRITEAFYRVDKSRSRAQGGAGLGLALCQAIAELHHGQLIFESTPGKGTVVKAILNGGRTKCE